MSKKIKLDDVLKYEQPTKYIVDSDIYKDEFEIPVLTAGKSFILGYTNETHGVFNEFPVIIFDDFTTAIKYVDFPFKVKSSAMKILKAEKEIADIKYLFYKMQTIRINSSEHKRYWISKYSQLQINLPPLKEQKRIATLLDTADALRQKDKELLKKYDELAQSLFLEMFGDPVTNEKGWEKKTISTYTDVFSGSTPRRDNLSYYEGSIPWVKTGEVCGELILDTEEKISEEALKNSSCKLFPINSVIIAMYGQGKTRGQVGMLGVEATTNQACAVIKPCKEINSKFLFRHLDLCYEDLRKLGQGGNQPNLSSAIVKAYKIICPPIELQNKFAAQIELIEKQKELMQENLNKSEALFQGLLQEAFK